MKTETLSEHHDRGLTAAEQALITRALRCLEAKYGRRGPRLDDVAAAKDYLRLRLQGLSYQVVGCLLLDARRRVIGYRELFRGTLDGAVVHPRVIVRTVLEWNAAALILARSEPSGDDEPTSNDLRVLAQTREALRLIDCRLLDHIVVGAAVVSCAERGLL